MKRLAPFVLLLGMVLTLPRVVGAIPPPAGLRWLTLGQRIPGSAKVLFHDPSIPLLGAAPSLYSASWTPAAGFTGLPTPISDRIAGQGLSLSLLYFAEDGDPVTGNPRLRVRLGIPTMAVGGQTLGIPTTEIFVQGNPTITTLDTATVVDRQFDHFDRNNAGRPEVILKLTWNSLPSPPPGVVQSQVCVTSNPDDMQIARQSGGVWGPLTTVTGYSCFMLKAPANIVKVESGDVAAGNITKTTGSLQFTSSNGQIVVNGQNWTDCGAFSALPGACPPTTVIKDSGLTARLTAQFNAAAKAAKEVAIIGRTGLTPASFLAGSQNGWLNPRGEVLYVDGPVNLALGATVQGKKLLIAKDSITIQGAVITPGSAQVAFVSLNGDINIAGTRFEGAALAVGAAHKISLAGPGGLNIKGLLSAPTISFAGRTTTSDTLATLNYDGRYQRGELLGLSAILRPLVTEPSL